MTTQIHTSEQTLTLDQFRRSRAYCADMRQHSCVGGNFEDDQEPVPGYIYLDVLYIGINCANETDMTPAQLRGAFHLHIANSEWLVDDLGLLERRLYDFALGEGYFQAPVRDPGRFALSDDICEAALNAAVLVVQDALGVTTGDAAGVYYSGDEKEDFYKALRRYGDHEAIYADELDTLPTLELLTVWAAFVLPASEAEWGSGRQIAAENFFFKKVEEFGVDTYQWETAKMSVEEMVADALQQCRAKS